MNFDAERISIESRFASLWQSEDISFENISFKPPRDIQGAALPFVRISIRNSASFTDAIAAGSVVNQHTGRIWVQVFVPEGTGTALARQLADQAAVVFDNARFNGIKCYAAEIKSVGNDGLGYYQLNVSIPYRRFS